MKSTKPELNRVGGGVLNTQVRINRQVCLLPVVIAALSLNVFVGCTHTIPMTKNILSIIQDNAGIADFQYYISEPILLHREDSAAKLDSKGHVKIALERETIEIVAVTPGKALYYTEDEEWLGVGFEKRDKTFLGFWHDDDKDKYYLFLDPADNYKSTQVFDGSKEAVGKVKYEVRYEYFNEQEEREPPYLLIKVNTKLVNINKTLPGRRTLRELPEHEDVKYDWPGGRK
ncbi:hypothetical protein FACS1894190_00310 [Spirochaetia bacterium]|nr:hypothetical protein FACS1894190_00310 [Spirochaetia bacterium]